MVYVFVLDLSLSKTVDREYLLILSPSEIKAIKELISSFESFIDYQVFPPKNGDASLKSPNPASSTKSKYLFIL